ncbi:MAG: hypothetical protein P4N60_08200 [Verrucomicrobiae bacterium]|nr:hypothetical protein [Verrucomicrobiae bacterium]
MPKPQIIIDLIGITIALVLTVASSLFLHGFIKRIEIEKELPAVRKKTNELLRGCPRNLRRNADAASHRIAFSPCLP